MELVSITAFAFKDRPLKNGEHSLKIRTTFKDGGKWVIKYDSLGVNVQPEFWNFTKNTPSATHPEKAWLENEIADAIARQRRVIAAEKGHQTFWGKVVDYVNSESFVEIEDFSVEPEPETLEPVIDQTTVFNLYRDTIAELKSNGKFGTVRQYKNAWSNICKFTGNKDLSFSDINMEWCNQFEKWMNGRKCKNGQNLKDTSKSSIFRNLRTVFNKAIKLKYVPKDAYPFNEYKISKFDLTTTKRAITGDDFKKIMAVELDSKDTQTVFARDMFRFSYLVGGINFVDMAYLTKVNIQKGTRGNDVLVFKREKTGVKITLPLETESSAIIERYAQGEGYIFPIFNTQRHKTPQQQENRRQSVLRTVNKELKKIGKLAGLNENINLTTYVARHTAATTLMKSNVKLPLISEMLGHKNLTTTQIYLAGFNEDEKREALRFL